MEVSTLDIMEDDSMFLSILRGRQSRRIADWKLSCGQAAPLTSRIEAPDMESSDCPCIKQEICNGVFWVTNECPQGIKEGFRPRVTFSQTCERCPNCGTPKTN